MCGRWCMGVFALALGMWFAVGVTGSPAQIIDMSKYPDISGGWGRSDVYQWARGETPPLTPEYQEDLRGEPAPTAPPAGTAPTRCIAVSRPACRGRCTPTRPWRSSSLPGTTYILIDHIHDDRRIFTDGRAWPTEDVEPSFSGYSIGHWVDDDGDGKYDALEVETRYLKGPRTLDGLLPTHEDNESIVKERIYLDKTNPKILHDQITLIDHAYTRPWTITKNYPRYQAPGPTGWPEEVCAEAQVWVNIGKDDYFLSSDGFLMPVKKDEAPPDLRYFKPAAH